ncbi:MAG TPA: hypothetical protein VJ933_09310, partial [Phaeodactylibacter sp.]|nr:hypothetical protein [Phaeodactylibacter sp.]
QLAMIAYANFDHKEFPVVTVRFTGAAADEANFQAYLDELHHAYERATPFAYLFDATDAALPGFKYQKMQADWLKENEAMMKEYCRGTAYVIANPLVRTVLKGIFALQQQPVPYYITGSQEEAKAWCHSMVQ